MIIFKVAPTGKQTWKVQAAGVYYAVTQRETSRSRATKTAVFCGRAVCRLSCQSLRLRGSGLGFRVRFLGVRIRGTLGDIDPLNKVPLKRVTSRVQKGPL